MRASQHTHTQVDTHKQPKRRKGGRGGVRETSEVGGNGDVQKIRVRTQSTSVFRMVELRSVELPPRSLFAG